jgi:CubicO group peptidase (beta-lactamase class C family)
MREGRAMAELDEDALVALDGALERHVDGMTPGIVALVARGSTVHVAAVGRADFGGPRMRRDTIFRISSMTKPVAAAAAMILVDEGRLALDEPVARLLPELAEPRVLKRLDGPLEETVPAERPVLVEHLPTLRLGLGAVMAPGEFPIAAAMEEKGVGVGPRLPEVAGMDGFAAAVGSLPLMRQPGDYWLYDTGMDLLGVVIERAAGQPLAEFMAERLFAPLGMADTGFFVPAEKLDRLAGCYWRDPATDCFERFDGEGEESRFARPPRFASAAGGLVSTADDWLAFARMMLAGGEHAGRRILSEASVRAMQSDRIPPEVKARSPFGPGFWEAGGWGLGMQVVTRPARGAPVGCGWVGGYGSSGYWDPASGLVGVHLTQRLMESPDPTEVLTDFWTCARAAAGV